MGERSGSDAELKAIDEVRANHVGALNAGNAAAWAAQFADDAIQMPPNAPANAGKEMIGAWSAAFLNRFRVQFILTVDEVRILGEWAFERGGYEIDLTPAGAPSIQDNGKYITIYRKDPSNSWKMARDIWNSNNPPPEM